MAVIAVLYALSNEGAIETQIVEKAIRDLNVDSEKNYPSDLTWRGSGARGSTGLSP